MTKEVIRYECTCEKCHNVWVTREKELPKNCPSCVARIRVWNKSEEEKGDDK